METGPWFKVSSERLEKRGIDLAIPLRREAQMKITRVAFPESVRLTCNQISHIWSSGQPIYNDCILIVSFVLVIFMCIYFLKNCACITDFIVKTFFVMRCEISVIPLTLLHSKRPKLYGVLAVLSAIGLKYNNYSRHGC